MGSRTSNRSAFIIYLVKVKTCLAFDKLLPAATIMMTVPHHPIRQRTASRLLQAFGSLAHFMWPKSILEGQSGRSSSCRTCSQWFRCNRRDHRTQDSGNQRTSRAPHVPAHARLAARPRPRWNSCCPTWYSPSTSRPTTQKKKSPHHHWGRSYVNRVAKYANELILGGGADLRRGFGRTSKREEWHAHQRHAKFENAKKIRKATTKPAAPASPGNPAAPGGQPAASSTPSAPGGRGPGNPTNDSSSPRQHFQRCENRQRAPTYICIAKLSLVMAFRRRQSQPYGAHLS